MTPRLIFTAALAALLLASCGTNTMPSAADMDRYYQKAEQIAEEKIALLDEKRRRGEISQEEFDMQAAAARARITNQATELAWARHEIVEAQKRSLGIPTGDHPVQVQVPGAGGQPTGESFYRKAGSVSAGTLQGNSPYGNPVLGGPNRGITPGTSGGALGGY
jgi:hypothetical protein